MEPESDNSSVAASSEDRQAQDDRAATSGILEDMVAEFQALDELSDQYEEDDDDDEEFLDGETGLEELEGESEYELAL